MTRRSAGRSSKYASTRHRPTASQKGDGADKKVLFNPDDLEGRAKGAIIEVCLDHDKGTLSLGINGGPLQHVLSGFPRGAAMRPFAYAVPVLQE